MNNTEQKGHPKMFKVFQPLQQKPAETQSNLPKSPYKPPKRIETLEQRERRLIYQRKYYYKKKTKNQKNIIDNKKNGWKKQSSCKVNKKTKNKQFCETVKGKKASTSGYNKNNTRQKILKINKNICNTPKNKVCETVGIKSSKHRAIQNDALKPKVKFNIEPNETREKSLSQVTHDNNEQNISNNGLSNKEDTSITCPVIFPSEIMEFSNSTRTLILAINSMHKTQQVIAINLIFKTLRNGNLNKLLENTTVGTITWAVPVNFTNDK